MDKEKFKNNLKNKTNILVDIAICLFIVVAIYFHSLNRPWIFYDERVIFEETVCPIPTSFGEIFEYFNSFGLTNNLSSTNLLYTSNSVNRSSLFGVPLLIIIGFFFQKNAALYHSLNLFLHIANTSLVYLILRWCFSNFIPLSRYIAIVLASIWAIHPVNVESILLSTNVGALLSYLIFFSLFYDFLKNKEKNKSTLRRIILPICFLLPMLTNEYIVTLPILFFIYSLIENYKSKPFVEALKLAWEQSLPYIIGLFIYLVYFLLSSFRFFQATSLNPIILFIERILWLSPQIFVHYLKLIFLPKVISVDQSALVHLGKSLFNWYPIICFIILLLWLGLPLTIFIQRKKCFSLTLLTLLFFISLLPFSHILSPTYCLIAERYFYLPLFFIIFGFAMLANVILSTSKGSPVALLPILCILLIASGIRSYIRTNDWKNDFVLLNSTINTSPNSLYKGLRTRHLGEAILKAATIKKKFEAEQYFIEAQNYLYKAVEELTKEKNKYPKLPLILKLYGIDYDSLLVKAAYLICLEPFNKYNEKNMEDVKVYKETLDMFKPYLQYIESFDPRTLELYANLLIKNNELAKAKKVFLYAYKKYPTSPFILMSLIRFEREIEKDLNNAKNYLTKALKLYPYSKDILFEALRQYQMENDLAKYTKYSYLYGLRTHSQFAYREALTGYLTLQDLENAKKTIDKLLAIDKNSPGTLYLASGYYIKKNDYIEALKLLNKAYVIGVQGQFVDKQLSFNITNSLAKIYLALGNNEQGVYFEKEALRFAN